MVIVTGGVAVTVDVYAVTVYVTDGLAAPTSIVDVTVIGVNVHGVSRALILTNSRFSSG